MSFTIKYFFICVTNTQTYERKAKKSSLAKKKKFYRIGYRTPSKIPSLNPIKLKIFHKMLLFVIRLTDSKKENLKLYSIGSKSYFVQLYNWGSFWKTNCQRLFWIKIARNALRFIFILKLSLLRFAFDI